MLGNGMMGRDLGATRRHDELTHGMRVTFKADRASLTLAAAPTGGEEGAAADRSRRLRASAADDARLPPGFLPCAAGIACQLRACPQAAQVEARTEDRPRGGIAWCARPRVEAARAAEPDGSGSPFGELLAPCVRHTAGQDDEDAEPSDSLAELTPNLRYRQRNVSIHDRRVSKQPSLRLVQTKKKESADAYGLPQQRVALRVRTRADGTLVVELKRE